MPHHYHAFVRGDDPDPDDPLKRDWATEFREAAGSGLNLFKDFGRGTLRSLVNTARVLERAGIIAPTAGALEGAATGLEAAEEEFPLAEAAGMFIGEAGQSLAGGAGMARGMVAAAKHGPRALSVLGKIGSAGHGGSAGRRIAADAAKFGPVEGPLFGTLPETSGALGMTELLAPESPAADALRTSTPLRIAAEGSLGPSLGAVFEGAGAVARATKRAPKRTPQEALDESVATYFDADVGKRHEIAEATGKGLDEFIEGSEDISGPVMERAVAMREAVRLQNEDEAFRHASAIRLYEDPQLMADTPAWAKEEAGISATGDGDQASMYDVLNPEVRDYSGPHDLDYLKDHPEDSFKASVEDYMKMHRLGEADEYVREEELFTGTRDYLGPRNMIERGRRHAAYIRNDVMADAKPVGSDRVVYRGWTGIDDKLEGSSEVLEDPLSASIAGGYADAFARRKRVLSDDSRFGEPSKYVDVRAKKLTEGQHDVTRGTMYEIRLPEGTPAVVTNSSELEYILPPRLELVVRKRFNDLQTPNGKYHRYYIVDAVDHGKRTPFEEGSLDDALTDDLETVLDKIRPWDQDRPDFDPIDLDELEEMAGALNRLPGHMDRFEQSIQGTENEYLAEALSRTRHGEMDGEASLARLAVEADNIMAKRRAVAVDDWDLIAEFDTHVLAPMSVYARRLAFLRRHVALSGTGAVAGGAAGAALAPGELQAAQDAEDPRVPPWVGGAIGGAIAGAIAVGFGSKTLGSWRSARAAKAGEVEGALERDRIWRVGISGGKLDLGDLDVVGSSKKGAGRVTEISAGDSEETLQALTLALRESGQKSVTVVDDAGDTLILRADGSRDYIFGEKAAPTKRAAARATEGSEASQVAPVEVGEAYEPDFVKPVEERDPARLAEDPMHETGRMLADYRRDPEGLATLDRINARLREDGSLDQIRTTREMADKRTGDLLFKLGGDVSGLVPRRNLGAIEVLAIDEAISAETKRHVQITKRLEDSALPGEVKESLLLARQAIEYRVSNYIKRVAKARSEFGRNLAMMKYTARGGKINDPTYWKMHATQLAKRDLTMSELADIDRLLEEGNLDELVDYIAGKRKTSIWEKAAGVIRAGYLNSPVTAMRNILGNADQAAYRAASDQVAFVFDRMLSGAATATHRATKGKAGRERFVVTKAPTAAFRSALDGATAAAQEVRAKLGGRTSDKRYFHRVGQTDLTKFDLKHAGGIPYKNKLADFYVNRLVFGSLGFQDRVFRSYAFNTALYEQAIAGARNAGLKRGTDGYAAAVKRGFLEPKDEAVVNAAEAAEIAVFQETTAVTKAVSGFAAGVERLTGPVGRVFTLPFVKTPTNIAAQTVMRTPIGLLDPKLRKAVMRFAREMDPDAQKYVVEKFADMTLGTAMLILGMVAKMRGNANGAYPRHAPDRERQTYRESGRQPYSVKWGDSWVKTIGLGPTAGLFNFGVVAMESAMSGDEEQADLDSIMDHVDQFVAILREVDSDQALPAMGAMFNSLYQQSAFTGINTAIKAMDDPERYMAALVGNVGRSLSPGGTLGARVATVTDPTVRKRELKEAGPLSPFAAGFMAAVPGLSDKLPARISPTTGEAVTREGGHSRLWNPGDPRAVSVDPVILELERLGTGVPAPQIPGSKDMSPAELERWERMYGRTAYAALSAMVGTSQYEAMGDEQKREVLEQLIADPRRGLSTGLRVLQAVRDSSVVDRR